MPSELRDNEKPEIPNEWLRRYARAYAKIIKWEEERRKREKKPPKDKNR